MNSIPVDDLDYRTGVIDNRQSQKRLSLKTSGNKKPEAK
jgi:hypothetical protein